MFEGIIAVPVIWLTFARVLMPRAGARPAPPRVAPPIAELKPQPKRESGRKAVPA